MLKPKYYHYEPLHTSKKCINKEIINTHQNQRKSIMGSRENNPGKLSWCVSPTECRQPGNYTLNQPLGISFFVLLMYCKPPTYLLYFTLCVCEFVAEGNVGVRGISSHQTFTAHKKHLEWDVVQVFLIVCLFVINEHEGYQG